MLKVDINILFTIINILILVAAMRIFLFKPIHKIIDERQSMINKSIADAEKAKNDAEMLKKQHSDELTGIEDEKKRLIQEARTKATGEYDRIVSEAQSKAGSIVESAKTEGERSKNEIIQQANTEIAQMVVNATAKIVMAKNNGDSTLYDDFLTKAGKTDD